jgi:hypothetical protein
MRPKRSPAGILAPLQTLGAGQDFLKLPAPVLPGSGAKGLSQPQYGMPRIPVKHPCFVNVD